MNNSRLCIVVTAVVILVGCSKKAPEIPPPEPTAAAIEIAVPYIIPQQWKTFDTAVIISLFVKQIYLFFPAMQMG